MRFISSIAEECANPPCPAGTKISERALPRRALLRGATKVRQLFRVAAWDNTADRRQAQSRPVEARGGLTRLPNGTDLGEKIAAVVAGEFFPTRRGGQISR